MTVGQQVNSSVQKPSNLENIEEGSAPQFCTNRVKKMVISTGLVAAGGGLAALMYWYQGWLGIVEVLAFAGLVALATGRRYRWFYVAAKTTPRDALALFRFIKLILQNKSFRRNDRSIPDVFRDNVKKHPNKVAFMFENREWTFKEVEEYSNKVANVFINLGYTKGDTVALFMENRPEFVCIWLGLAKAGIIVPLINTNLRDQSLLHSFNIAFVKAIIFGSELQSALRDICGNLDSSIRIFRWAEDPSKQDLTLGEDLTKMISTASAEAPILKYKLNYTDKLLYIYTSGTTGLPKAAVITSARFMFLSTAVYHLPGFTKEDRFYTPLPLYHTAGGVTVVGQCLISGCSVALRRKFSASSFFKDCAQYNCTVAQYIGEMCRYILATPPSPTDKQHRVRVVFGNGLRPQIWKEFVERFNIQQVAEFYGATEGNANIVNIDNTFGSIGFVSRIVPSLYPISIIKADPATGEPIRNSQGLCQVCGPDEPGVFVGKIILNDPSREFLGYVDAAASEKKVVRDVFEKGDAAFLSGDIVVADELGYLYFKDRTGDTFRWKGENVSTTEVEAIVSNLVNYRDCVVYGVEIKGQEGRAGMAAILDEEATLNLSVLANGLKAKLPAYARPLFVRSLRQLDRTGTFKLRKVDLQKEGFDPRTITDPLYYWDNGEYKDLTLEAYDAIVSGKIRF